MLKSIEEELLKQVGTVVSDNRRWLLLIFTIEEFS
jgi:hypothetical protein